MNDAAQAVPRLSVLVPTYNYADSIVESLESVMDQRVEGVEIVVADDGSTDDTAERLHPMAERGEIRYFRQENSGPATARNLAISHARGRYLMLLDADDALLAGCLRRTLEFLEAHPGVGLFFTNYRIFDDQGVLSESGVDEWTVFRSIPHREVGPGQWIFEGSLAPYIVRHGGFMHTSGLTVAREIVEEVGPFRDGFSYAEDDEFYARVAHATQSAYLDEVLTTKRNHDRSVIHDPANALRNARHLVELTKIQGEYYSGDPELSGILAEKLRRSTISLCWNLIDQGHGQEARSRLRVELSGDPLHAPYWKLFFKSLLPG